MNSKAIALGIVGILLMGINLAVISPYVMEVTEETLSTATVMDNETWEDEEWLNATSERSFFAWNLSNAAALQSGDETEMEFEQLGPFTYELSTIREVLYHDEEAGVLTYREYNEYNWLDGESGDVQLTNINILFNCFQLLYGDVDWKSLHNISMDCIRIEILILSRCSTLCTIQFYSHF